MIHFAVVERLAGVSLRNTFSRSKNRSKELGSECIFHRSQDDPQILMLTLTPVFHLPINESDPAIKKSQFLHSICSACTKQSRIRGWINLNRNNLAVR